MTMRHAANVDPRRVKPRGVRGRKEREEVSHSEEIENSGGVVLRHANREEGGPMAAERHFSARRQDRGRKVKKREPPLRGRGSLELIIEISTESLILAQDERWRRA